MTGQLQYHDETRGMQPQGTVTEGFLVSLIHLQLIEKDDAQGDPQAIVPTGGQTSSHGPCQVPPLEVQAAISQPAGPFDAQ